MNVSFPNGRTVTMHGYRGRTPVEYRVRLYDCNTNPSGQVIEAEIGYRGNFWTLDKWGRVRRVSYGKYVTLCDYAIITSNIHPQ